MSEQTRQNKGRGIVDRKLVETPSNFIASRPKAALLFWLFGDFRCGVLLLLVILVIYINIEIGNKKMLNVRLAGDPVWEIAVHLAVAGDVSDAVFLCCPCFPRDALDEVWDLIESVYEFFLPTYFFLLDGAQLVVRLCSDYSVVSFWAIDISRCHHMLYLSNHHL